MLQNVLGKLFSALVIGLSLIGAGAAFGQFQLLPPTEPPAAFVREAFATPYGSALMAEFDRALRAGADPSCLQSKNLSADQVTERGRAYLAAAGVRMLDKLASFVDTKLYAEKFAAAAGADAVAELARLREDADVKRYNEIGRAWALAQVADVVVETFDRYVIITRATLLMKPVGPFASGNDELRRHMPSEAAVDTELNEFRERAKSAALERYLELEEASSDAVRASLKPEAAQANPVTLFRGIENDLATLCIPMR
jgi:hypothetical protein